MTAQELVIPRFRVFSQEMILGLAAATIPFLLAGPQWLVGTLVNSILFLTAMKVEKKYWWPMIILPSMAVVARGVIFGPFTWVLIYFMPIIWLGNWILMNLAKKNILLAAVAKALILFGAANIYFRLGLAPKMFLQSMGIIQLMTAVAGGAIANGLSSKSK